MLKLTAKQLIESEMPFALLAVEKIQGNPKLAYNIGKTWKEAKKEIEAIREQIVEVYKAFGAKEDNGQFELGLKELSTEQKAEFDRQIKEVHAIEIELWGSPITLAEIEKAKMDLSPSQCDLLSWLIVEAIPEPEKAAEASA